MSIGAKIFPTCLRASGLSSMHTSCCLVQMKNRVKRFQIERTIPLYEHNLGGRQQGYRCFLRSVYILAFPRSPAHIHRTSSPPFLTDIIKRGCEHRSSNSSDPIPCSIRIHSSRPVEMCIEQVPQSVYFFTFENGTIRILDSVELF